MAGLDWLTARPVAHRGLHDAARGVIENTRGAVRAAVEAGYAIEVDVQASADGVPVVFHDDTLDRLTVETGPVRARTLGELRAVRFKSTADGFWTLDELLEEVAGRSTLVVEVKSLFDGDLALAGSVADRLAAYRGPVVAKSFDPQVVLAIKERQPKLVRGIIGCEYQADKDWGRMTERQRWSLRNLAHWPRTRPDFISWHVTDLPRLSVTLAKRLTGAPILTWTVRTPADQARAGLHADQMVFEGFRP